MKTFLKIFLVLFVFLIFGIFIFVFTFNLNSYKDLIAEKVSIALGRSVTIGSMDMKLAMVPTIRIRDVRIENPDSFSADKPFVWISTGDVTVALAPLLSDRIEIQSIDLGKTMMNLIQNGNKKNWIFPKKENASLPLEQKNKNFSIRVDNITVQKLDIQAINEKMTHNLSLNNVSFKQLKVFSFNFTADNRTFKVTGTVDDLLELVQQQPDYLFNIEISNADISVNLSGSIGDTTKFENLLLNTNVTVMDIKKSCENFGIKNALIPNQKAKLEAVFQGNLTDFEITKLNFALGGSKLYTNLTGSVRNLETTPQVDLKGTLVLSDMTLGQFWHLKPFSMDIDTTLMLREISLHKLYLSAERSDLLAEGSLLWQNDKPLLKLGFKSEYFDIHDLYQEVNTGYAMPRVKHTKVKMIPNGYIDASFLNYLNADVSFNLPHLKISEQIKDYLGVSGKIKLLDGVLSTDDAQVSFLGGNVLTDIVVDVRSQQTKYDTKIRFSDIKPDFVKSISKFIRGGTVDGYLDLNAQGNTIQDIIKQLNGNAEIEFSDGTVINEKFNELPSSMGVSLRTPNMVALSTTDLESRILCGAVRLNIRDGRIISDDTIALETSTINFLIGGDIDLTTEKMNVSLLPFFPKLGDLSISRLIKIGGTLLQPSAALNQDELKKQVLQFGINKIFKTDTSKAEKEEYKPYSICQNILGRLTVAQQKEKELKNQMIPLPDSVVKTLEKQPEQSPQEQFKDQLMNSLFQVLQ